MVHVRILPGFGALVSLNGSNLRSSRYKRLLSSHLKYFDIAGCRDCWHGEVDILFEDNLPVKLICEDGSGDCFIC